MFLQRYSTAKSRNPSVVERGARRFGNAEWLRRYVKQPCVVLLGGVAIPHFRLRVGQGQVRGDLLPSYWSAAAIFVKDALFSIPIDKFDRDGEGSVPETNAIRAYAPSDFDSTERFPNVAALEFPVDEVRLVDAIRDLQNQRPSYRFVDALWEWLGYAWGVADTKNPIRSGRGLPCAQFVTSAFGLANVELLPGIAAGGATPESIWTTALWWNHAFGSEKSDCVRGYFRVLQPAAAAVGFKDHMVKAVVQPSKAQRSSIDDELSRRSRATPTDARRKRR